MVWSQVESFWWLAVLLVCMDKWDLLPGEVLPLLLGGKGFLGQQTTNYTIIHQRSVGLKIPFHLILAIWWCGSGSPARWNLRLCLSWWKWSSSSPSAPSSSSSSPTKRKYTITIYRKCNDHHCPDKIHAFFGPRGQWTARPKLCCQTNLSNG